MNADPADHGPALLSLARAAIAADLHLPTPRVPRPDEPWLDHDREPWLDAAGAAFVTLHSRLTGRLRGCIGTLAAYRPLREDVAGNARAAAFRDPRFTPVTADEYDGLHVEVSVLSPPEPLPHSDRADAVSRLRPGVDGVLLEYDGHRGTYLPQVWAQIPDPSDFLDSLAQKARLPYGFWAPGVRLSRYTVTPYEEPR